MLLAQCKNPVAIVLLGVLDERKILRYPCEAPETPGLMFVPKPLVSINEQIIEKIKKVTGLKDNLKVDVSQDFVGEVNLTDGRIASMYLASIESGSELIQEDWAVLPDLLRAMPKTRNRLTYLKAWQVMTGSLTLNTKVIEEEEMNRHVQSDKDRQQ